MADEVARFVIEEVPTYRQHATQYRVWLRSWRGHEVPISAGGYEE